MNIGDNIRRRRLELNMSQQELADAMGYKTRSSIAKIEAGVSDISQSKLHSMAYILNTTVDYLLTGNAPENAGGFSNVMTKPALHRLIGATNRNIAVILAGGHSTRNQQNTPNQFVLVKGKPIIIYCMEAYEKHPAISEIYVVCLKGWENIITAYAQEYNITKLSGLIPAGDTGILSVKNSIEWLQNTCNASDNVIFQESTRPMVTQEMISNTLRCCQENQNAIIYELMDEYVQFMTEPGNIGVKYLDRNRLLSTQSPDAYNFASISATLREAEKSHHRFDETCCSLFMYNMGQKLTFCPGIRYNIKIVRQEDVALFEALLEANKHI